MNRTAEVTHTAVGRFALLECSACGPLAVAALHQVLFGDHDITVAFHANLHLETVHQES